jgi:hypothetical protein
MRGLLARGVFGDLVYLPVRRFGLGSPGLKTKRYVTLAST